jgi:hypothetical protein
MHYGGRYTVPVIPGPVAKDSYPPVQVPGNSSSIPGLGDKMDPGWHTVFTLLACCLLADTAAAVAVWWLRS